MMSAQVDPLSYLIPSIIAAIISFVVVAMNRFAKTSDTTISGTVEIKGMKENLTNIEHNIERSFERVGHEANDNLRCIDDQLRKLNDRLNDIWNKLELNTYRIDQLEKRINGKNGGSKSAA